MIAKHDGTEIFLLDSGMTYIPVPGGVVLEQTFIPGVQLIYDLEGDTRINIRLEDNEERKAEREDRKVERETRQVLQTAAMSTFHAAMHLIPTPEGTPEGVEQPEVGLKLVPNEPEPPKAG